MLTVWLLSAMFSNVGSAVPYYFADGVYKSEQSCLSAINLTSVQKIVQSSKGEISLKCEQVEVR